MNKNIIYLFINLFGYFILLNINYTTLLCQIIQVKIDSVNNLMNNGDYLSAEVLSKDILNQLQKDTISNDNLVFAVQKFLLQSLFIQDKLGELKFNVENLSNELKMKNDTNSFEYVTLLQYKLVSEFRNLSSTQIQKRLSNISDILQDLSYLLFKQPGQFINNQEYPYLETQYKPITMFDKKMEIDNINRYMQEFLKFIATKIGKDNWYYSWSLLTWSDYLCNYGLYEESIEKNKEVLEALGKHHEYDTTAFDFTPNNNLSADYLYLGNYKEALKYTEKAYKKVINQKISTEAGIIMTKLASLNHYLGNFDLSNKYFLMTDSMLTNHYNFIINVVGSGRILDFKEYINVVLAKNLINWSALLIDEKKYELALEKINKAFSYLNYSNSFDYTIKKKSCIMNSANIYSLQNKKDSADLYFEKALNTDINIIKKIMFSMTDSRREEFNSIFEQDFNLFYNYLLQRYKNQYNIIDYGLNLRLSTKSLLFYASKKINEKINSSNNPVVSQYYSIFKMLNDIIASNQINGDWKYIDSLEKSRNAVEQILINSIDLTHDELFSSERNWKILQKELQPNEAAVEIIRIPKFGYYKNSGNNKANYYAYSDTSVYFAFIISKYCGNHPKIVILDSLNKFENEYYKKYEDAINVPPNDLVKYSSKQILVNTKKSLHTLFKLYLNKILSTVPSAKKIYISKDGIYNKINLGILINNSNKYVFQDMDIINLSSIEDLKRKEECFTTNSPNSPNSKKLKKCVLFGNPDFNKETQIDTNNIAGLYIYNEKILTQYLTRGYKSRWTNLPNTKFEINAVDKIFRSHKWETQVFMRENARENEIKQINSPEILHIATHGFFLSNEQKDKYFFESDNSKTDNLMLMSGLVFAGANYFKDTFNKKNKLEASQIAEDGVLTAYESVNLNLKNTDLVVLSACETGLGEIKNGEGVYGLQRAFQLAGAKKVLMSLWKVNDKATSLLMQFFYKAYLQTNDVNFSLKTAMESLMKIKGYEHPKFWGAFVAFGM